MIFPPDGLRVTVDEKRSQMNGAEIPPAGQVRKSGQHQAKRLEVE
jgi:hypothetical protein